MGERIKVIRFK